MTTKRKIIIIDLTKDEEGDNETNVNVKEEDPRFEELRQINKRLNIAPLANPYWSEKPKEEYERYWALPFDCIECTKNVKVCPNCNWEFLNKDILTQDWQNYE